MNICNICKSKKIIKVDDFKPYMDVEMKFELYDCLTCYTRFAKDIDLEKKKTLLHSNNSQSSYLSMYLKANYMNNLYSVNLDRARSKLTEGNIFLKDVLEYVEEKKDKKLSILEVGCSTGYIIAYLQKVGYINSFGIDIAKEPIEYARKTFGEYYGFREEENIKYDIIFFNGVIGCVEHPYEFLNYFLDCLNLNGVLFFNAPNIDSIIEVDEKWVSSPPPDVNYLFKKDLFKNLLGNKYEVDFYTTHSPLIILAKYINKFKKRSNNIYPRNFYKTPIHRYKNSTSIYKNIIKKIIAFLIKLLIKLKIITSYSDEYGIIYKIKKLSK